MCSPNCNDQIAARAFGATEHISPLAYDRLMEFDAIFVTMFKIRESFESRWMDVAHRLADAGKRVVLFQEAETSWPMGRSWEEQRDFIELLGKVHLFLTHNERDVRLWGQFCRKGTAIRWRTCLDLGGLHRLSIDPAEKQRAILCGSSYNSRANGLTGLLACKGMGYPLWHHDRSTGYEEQNREMPYLCDTRIAKEIPHSGWYEWLAAISGAYIAVHPMPAAAAGRDQIAFAALGIPCVGNVELDIQRELFPDLYLDDLYDPDGIRMLVSQLLGDDDFYKDCRDRAMKRVSQYDLPAAAVQAREIKQTVWGWE
jgi:hypothetical protein